MNEMPSAYVARWSGDYRASGTPVEYTPIDIEQSLYVKIGDFRVTLRDDGVLVVQTLATSDNYQMQVLPVAVNQVNLVAFGGER